jgi:hypothetical protein
MAKRSAAITFRNTYVEEFLAERATVTAEQAKRTVGRPRAASSDRGAVSSSEQLLSVHQIAARDLERYYTVLKQSLPKFSDDEATAIVNACKGWKADPKSGAALLPVQLRDALKRCLVVLGGNDGSALVAKLIGLNSMQAWAVIDAAERYWKALAELGEHQVALKLSGLGEH